MPPPSPRRSRAFRTTPSDLASRSPTEGTSTCSGTTPPRPSPTSSQLAPVCGGRPGGVGGEGSAQPGYAHLLLGDLISALRQMEVRRRADRRLRDSVSINAQDRAEVLLAAGRHVGRRWKHSRQPWTPTARDVSHDSRPSASSCWRGRCSHEDPAPCPQGRAQRSTPIRASTRARAGRTGRGAGPDRGDLGRRPSSRDSAPPRTTSSRSCGASGHRRDAEQLALHVVRLCIRRGELDDAAARLRRIRITDDTPIGTRLLAREVRAELARARGRRKSAREHVRAGLQDLHAWQASFGSLDLQSTIVGHGNTLARLGLELALEDGSPEVVFEWSERARALASKVTTLRPPPDPRAGRRPHRAAAARPGGDGRRRGSCGSGSGRRPGTPPRARSTSRPTLEALQARLRRTAPRWSRTSCSATRSPRSVVTGDDAARRTARRSRARARPAGPDRGRPRLRRAQPGRLVRRRPCARRSTRTWRRSPTSWSLRCWS